MFNVDVLFGRFLPVFREVVARCICLCVYVFFWESSSYQVVCVVFFLGLFRVCLGLGFFLGLSFGVSRWF